MDRLLVAIGVVCLWAGTGIKGGEGKPPALLAAEKARSPGELRTGRVRGQIETFPGSEMHLESLDLRFAGEQALMANTMHKTERDSAGHALPALGWVGIVNTLRRDGRLWWHPTGTTSAYALAADSPAGDETPDPRTIGLYPWADNAAMYERMLLDGSNETGRSLAGLEQIPSRLHEIGVRYEETLRTNPDAVKFDEQVDAGVHVVTAVVGDAKLRWWIDPAQGWNPVRTVVWENDTLLSETRITNRQHGEAWFPEDVASFSPQYEQGKKPFQVTTVYKAAFNAPDDPADLTPQDVGLEVGMKVIVADGRTSQVLYWDGKDAVPQELLQRRVERGEVSLGASVAAAAQGDASTSQPMWRGDAAPAGMSAEPDTGLVIRRRTEGDWERYTRLFIEKYKLDDDQTQKAWSILRSAQALAEGYLVRHKADLADVEKRLAEAAGGSTPDVAGKRSALEQRKTKLLAPIDEIFERQLKARLERLPTRAQRSAVDGRAAPKDAAP